MSLRSPLIHGLPCIACVKQEIDQLTRTEEHHLLSGNKRRGDAFSIPLCKWHHRGEPLYGFSATEMAQSAGPSLQKSSKKFHARYGSDNELLEQTNDQLGLTVSG